MKPQELNLNCELFDEFRQALDHAVQIILVRMIEKGLDSGSIVGKLDISLRVSPTEDGRGIVIGTDQVTMDELIGEMDE